MKQQKDNWVKILFSFAAPCKGKMALSVFCAILSVAGGFIPFWAVYEILLAFINQNVTLNGILIWCLVGAVGYLLRVACHGISTIMAHISAYTILEGIRLKIADRLMKAPLGEVMGRRIGYLKNIIMDKVEDLEPPLAHMIPELTSNLPKYFCSRVPMPPEIQQYWQHLSRLHQAHTKPMNIGPHQIHWICATYR